GFPLRAVSTGRIAGTLLDQDGQAVTSATLTLHPRRRGQASAGDLLISSGALVLPRATVSPPEFSIVGVTPGDYTLVARTGAPGRMTAAATTQAGAPLWNVTDITVGDGQDLTGLVLRLQPGITISGTMVFEGASLASP